jgi:hypothetical protein
MTRYCPFCPKDRNGNRRQMLLNNGTKCHGCGSIYTPTKPAEITHFPKKDATP